MSASAMPGLLVEKRSASDRGKTEWGWLHSRHTFSFGDYYDLNYSGFRTLLVINDDIVEPGMGFGTHPHRDMEIFSYVIEGELQHRDSMGNGSVITTGDLQYMSAGTGIRHSEFNPSKDRRVHFLQIWIQPNQTGGEPRYAEHRRTNGTPGTGLTLLFSGSGREGSVQIRQDADMYFGKLTRGQKGTITLQAARGAWVQAIRGRLGVNNVTLDEADGAGVSGNGDMVLTAVNDSEFLVMLLP
jgi:quercetin 2,3-dioxygenase